MPGETAQQHILLHPQRRLCFRLDVFPLAELCCKKSRAIFMKRQRVLSIAVNPVQNLQMVFGIVSDWYTSSFIRL